MLVWCTDANWSERGGLWWGTLQALKWMLPGPSLDLKPVPWETVYSRLEVLRERPSTSAPRADAPASSSGSDDLTEAVLARVGTDPAGAAAAGVDDLDGAAGLEVVDAAEDASNAGNAGALGSAADVRSHAAAAKFGDEALESGSSAPGDTARRQSQVEMDKPLRERLRSGGKGRSMQDVVSEDTGGKSARARRCSEAFEGGSPSASKSRRVGQ